MIRKHILAGAMLIALGACSGGSTGGTAVPKTEAEKQKLGSDIATLMTDPKMFEGLFDSMTNSLMPSLGNMCAGMPADKQPDCAERMTKLQPTIEASMKDAMDQTKAIMPELMQEMGGIMARVYTGEELAKMHDFYASPEGKSIMQKQPQVMAEYMPKVMQRMQGMQAGMMAKMQKRIADAVAADAPAPN